MSLRNPSMEDIPEPVMVEILSRLPVKTIIHCKCVCKKWLGLVSDSYFADLHLSGSPSGLMIHHIPEKETDDCIKPGILKWVEVEDKPDHHRLHHDPVMSLDLNLAPIFQNTDIWMIGSVDGLICLWQYGEGKDITLICNPVTREYMMLPLPRQQYNREGYAIFVYCFGVGSRTNEYKVIRIFKGDIPPDYFISKPRPSLLEEAEVYTLGTGQWRSLGHVPYFIDRANGSFLNGHAHWLASGQDSHEEIYTFDYDNETFKFFPSPPVEIIQESRIIHRDLTVLKGCLCQCNIFDSETRIWVMKEYGIKTSWHKEVIIKPRIGDDLDCLMIKHLRDGTILMVCCGQKLLVYSFERRTIEDMEIFDPYFSVIVYRPSFLKLQKFESECIHVF